MTIHFLPRAVLGSIVFTGLIGLTPLVRASTDTETAAAARLIQTQLPHGIDLDQADAETMARAVSRATLGRRPQAVAILSTALTGGGGGAKNKKGRERSGDFVIRVFKAALLAAPDQASALTEAAASLYPKYTDQLSAVLNGSDKRLAAYDYKDRPDYKDRVDYKDTADYKDRGVQPVAGISDLGDPGLDPSFGFGPGFPGSPGFVGSPPSGGFALPPVSLPAPSAAPVTSVVNQ